MIYMATTQAPDHAPVGPTPRDRARRHATRRSGRGRVPQSHRATASSPTPEPVDWESIDRLFHFARERAEERTSRAEAVADQETAGLERLALHVMRTLYRQAKQQQERILVGCAVNYFRARALRDAHHPDFLGTWIGPASA